MERSLILLVGSPGSGKSTLGKNLKKELASTISIEHLSVGDTVRAIGKGAIDSTYKNAILSHLNSLDRNLLLPNEIIYRVVSEALLRTESSELILLDGYPRTATQTDDMRELALLDDRNLLGAIVTHTDEDTALTRLLKRRPRDYEQPLTHAQAVDRIERDKSQLNGALYHLGATALPLYYVETSGEKIDTTASGLAIVRRLISSVDDVAY